MKNFQIFLGIALMAAFMMTSIPADAQSRRDRKDAKKEAKRLAKQDYKTMTLPLDRQLALYYAKVQELDEEGMPKYLQESSTAVGNTYSTAKMEAVNIAKVRLAQQISTMVMSQAKIDLGNKQVSAEDAASYSMALEKSTLMVAQKLNRIIYGQDYYRVLSNKNYEVVVVILYDSKVVKEMVIEEAREQLKKELDNFTPEHEKLLENIVDKGVKGSDEEK